MCTICQLDFSITFLCNVGMNRLKVNNYFLEIKDLQHFQPFNQSQTFVLVQERHGLEAQSQGFFGLTICKIQ